MLRKSPERTEALMAANRTNSQLSTGPRTDLGKQLSRGNALKHWGRAETIRPLLAALEEDPEEFERVRDALYQALAPRDAFEEIIVDDMADIHWRTSPRGVEGSQPRRRNAQHPAQSGHGGHLSRAHGEGVRREVEAAKGVSGDSRGPEATDGRPTDGPSAGTIRQRTAYRAPGRRRFRPRGCRRIGARLARSRGIGHWILTNEAGMLFDISHFHFWNSVKAGMCMKTKVVKRRKPEC